MPTSLVTGGAGFIGAHVVNHLLGAGHQVVVLDDLSGGFRENVAPQAAFIEGSITDHNLLARLFEEHSFDYVYHLAAYAAEGLSHFIRRFNYTNNLIGSVNLINESVKHKVRCFVFTSSIAVYGTGRLPLREDMNPEPEDPYGVAKLAVEQDLKACRRFFGLDSIIFRPHNVYGEFQNLGDRYRNVVGIFMNQLMQNQPLTIFGDGEQTRAFSYVGTVAPAIARSVNIPEAYNKVFNIGGDQHYSVNELARTLLKVVKKECKIRRLPPRNEVQDAYSDHTLAHRIFGQPETVSLEEGLDRMWAWAQRRGVAYSKPFRSIEITEKLPAIWTENPEQILAG